MLEISFVQVFENFSKQLNFQSKKAADLILAQISPTPWPAIMSKGRGLYSCINYAKGGGAYTELHKLCQRGGAYTVAYIMPKGEELIHSCTNHTKGAGLNMRVLPSLVQF